MSKFSKRSDAAEIMDDWTEGGPSMDQTLHELDNVNRFLGGNAVSTNGLKKLLGDKMKGKNTFTIADLGCGSGDMLKRMATWGRKNKVSLILTGVDANNNIIDFAKQQSKKLPEINYTTSDIFSPEFKARSFDILHCSLFTHHFHDDAFVKLLAQMKKQAKLGIIINDLHRHFLAYYSIKYITKAVSRSEMVKHDAPVSVLRAFTRKEIINLLQKAGITRFEINWCWAFRWQIIIYAD